MKAMVLHAPGQPLRLETRPDPVPGPGAVRLRVAACAVCRTDLHIVDGELPAPRLPLVPGHEIVGSVDALGPGVESLHLDQRVGVPWLAHTCGHCRYCGEGRENLCDGALFTGFSRDGGCQPRDGGGRPGDERGQAFARSMGAAWAGGSDVLPPQPLDAAIIFAPDGALVPQALKAVRKGGRVVCGGIHMSDIPSFSYRLLREERELVSVANLTRRDGIDALLLAGAAVLIP